jgi:hypothetical protein
MVRLHLVKAMLMVLLVAFALAAAGTPADDPSIGPIRLERVADDLICSGDLPVISKHTIKRASAKTLNGIIWTHGAQSAVGLPFEFGIRLSLDKEEKKGPAARATFTVTPKDKTNNKGKRHLVVAITWKKLAFEKGYTEIEFDNDGTTILRESKEVYKGSPKCWEIVLVDPLGIDSDGKGKPLPPGQYNVDVRVDFEDGQCLTFQGIELTIGGLYFTRPGVRLRRTPGR